MSDPSDLSNLRDIVLPPEVSLWPPAPGWWIVATACVAVAAGFAALMVARHRQNAYRREALHALEEIDGSTDSAAARQISAILKRTALAAYPREEVAPLSGVAWLAFLDRTGRTEAFTQGPARCLPALAFGSAGEKEAIAAIIEEARRWIRNHRAEAGERR
jgi:Domain of unknown function (DUF4381)